MCSSRPNLHKYVGRTEEKLTKDNQQPAMLLPARWWPDTLPEFESGGWWQRPHTRVKCRQCQCGFVEKPSLGSSKCHRCERRIEIKCDRLDGIILTNVDPRYAGELDDPQGGDAKMRMEQVREVMTVNQETEDQSSWIWLTPE